MFKYPLVGCRVRLWVQFPGLVQEKLIKIILQMHSELFWIKVCPKCTRVDWTNTLQIIPFHRMPVKLKLVYWCQFATCHLRTTNVFIKISLASCDVIAPSIFAIFDCSISHSSSTTVIFENIDKRAQQYGCGGENFFGLSELTTRTLAGRLIPSTALLCTWANLPPIKKLAFRWRRGTEAAGKWQTKSEPAACGRLCSTGHSWN